MEFLVRVSEDKYIKNGTSIYYTEAMKLMYDAIKSEIEKRDNNKWRNERYFCEECDELCKYYKTVFDHLYSRYSKKKVMPG